MFRKPMTARRLRRGSLTMELLLVLPIVLALLLGTVQFSLLSVARQQVMGASREGARVAARGGSAADVEATVRLYLGGGRFSNAEVSTNLNAASGLPLPSGAPVEVVVRIGATEAVPDLLPFLGFSLSGEHLLGRTVMRKE
jgi:hypothetical protein